MIKVTRKFVYMVDGKEYPDQKQAQKAAQEANRNEKRMVLTKMIKEATDPTMAALAIMEHFHIYNKTEGKVPGYRRKKPKVEWHDQPNMEDQLS